MARTATADETTCLERLEPIVRNVIAPAAAKVDREGAYPAAQMRALADAGLLGLISAREVGGLGLSHRAAAEVIERVSNACASTSMVLCMHYAAAAVIEAYGPRALREAIASGRHTTSLAFSEQGSRSHFWAPVGTAEVDGDRVRLDAHKTWVTSAGEVDSYVWSSLPIDTGTGPSTLWLVSADADGLEITAPFDGLGMRGNCSCPVVAKGAFVDKEAMLGPDGGGFDIMLKVVFPYFQLMSAACCLGTMEAAMAKTVAHVTGTELEHLDQKLCDLPTIRANLARMRIKIDMVRGLLLDTIHALESGREDAMLRVLEIKAAASDTSIEVTDLAMRVCGGAAFHHDGGVERHFRDARAATVMAPTSDVLFDFIGKTMCGQPMFD
jgi:alkylation response protein AidB-like acyl-CoA dehydrogenase